MHNSLSKLILFILFCTLQFTYINAQTNNLHSKLIADSEEFIKRKMKSDNIVGISAAIILDDSIIWKKGFGFADKKTGIPMTENTLVNIGSITKTFTALSVMQLSEKSLIDINKP
jgi:CubicO group peptidase (beta-lactamase class C family)